jgi:hypothetical protein
VLGGGTFHTGGFNETLNTLSLGTSSTIDLGAGASVLHFAPSSLNNWSGLLAIANWGGLQAGGGIDQVFVGTNGYSGLTHGQLNSIKFGSMPTGAMLLASGEVVPNSGAPMPLPVLGDFNGDGSAGMDDISTMLSAFTNLAAYQAAHLISDGDLLAIAVTSTTPAPSIIAISARCLVISRCLNPGPFNWEMVSRC